MDRVYEEIHTERKSTGDTRPPSEHLALSCDAEVRDFASKCLARECGTSARVARTNADLRESVLRYSLSGCSELSANSMSNALVEFFGENSADVKLKCAWVESGGAKQFMATSLQLVVDPRKLFENRKTRAIATARWYFQAAAVAALVLACSVPLAYHYYLHADEE
jgi:hypothetical protein